MPRGCRAAIPLGGSIALPDGDERMGLAQGADVGRGPCRMVGGGLATARGPLRIGLSGVSGTEDSGSTTGARLAGFLGRLAADPAGSHLAHSVLLGVGFALAAVLLARTFLPFARRAGTRGRSRWLGGGSPSVPPVVWGVGLAGGLEGLRSRVAGGSGRSRAIGSLAGARRRVSRVRPRPISRLRAPARASASPCCRDDSSGGRLPGTGDESIDRRVDQAILAGARPGRAYRMARRDLRSITARRLVLWSALAATSLGPAMVLSPTTDSRPVGPGVVFLADQPGHARPRRRPWRWPRSPSTPGIDVAHVGARDVDRVNAPWRESWPRTDRRFRDGPVAWHRPGVSLLAANLTRPMSARPG